METSVYFAQFEYQIVWRTFQLQVDCKWCANTIYNRSIFNLALSNLRRSIAIDVYLCQL
ncbi:hypothetical protein [Chamaesiphon sp.]|uniref:hypothetical protein n=1 Tax=Chamaesiphon sp. TaxID=2814140 RepID=UPI0035936ECB